MQMTSLMKLTVTGLSRYDVDGLTGAHVYTMNPTDGENENRLGLETIKFSAPYALFEIVRGYGLKFPVELEAEVEISMGAQNKPVLKILGLHPIRAVAQPAKA